MIVDRFVCPIIILLASSMEGKACLWPVQPPCFLFPKACAAAYAHMYHITSTMNANWYLPLPHLYFNSSIRYPNSYHNPHTSSILLICAGGELMLGLIDATLSFLPVSPTAGGRSEYGGGGGPVSRGPSIINSACLLAALGVMFAYLVAVCLAAAKSPGAIGPVTPTTCSGEGILTISTSPGLAGSFGVGRGLDSAARVWMDSLRFRAVGPPPPISRTLRMILSRMVMFGAGASLTRRHQAGLRWIPISASRIWPRSRRWRISSRSSFGEVNP